MGLNSIKGRSVFRNEWTDMREERDRVDTGEPVETTVSYRHGAPVRPASPPGWSGRFLKKMKLMEYLIFSNRMRGDLYNYTVWG